MPTVRIPLAGVFNQRGLAGNAALVANQDQRFLNCVFELANDPITQKAEFRVAKRPGWGVDSIVAAGSISTGIIKPKSLNANITAFGDTNSTIYLGSVSVGTITGRALHFTETIVSALSHVMIKSSDGTGWYFVDGAQSVTAYTGDTNGTAVVTDVQPSTAGMYVGQLVAGTDITAGTRILTVDSYSQFTMNAIATGTTNNLAITKTPIAKILDADFATTGAFVSAFVQLDGYLFYSNEDGFVRNSELNSVTSYLATAKFAPNMAPDPPVALARHKNLLIILGGSSKEGAYNAGNESGSPLRRAPQFFDRVGCLDQRSLTTIENDIYFVSSPDAGDIGVYRIRDMQATRVSTPWIDRILGTIAVSGAIYASSFRLGGYPYAAFFVSIASEDADQLLMESGEFLLLETGDNILLESGATETSSFARWLIYNAAINTWMEWDSTEATFVDGFGSNTSNQIVATSRVMNGGKVYTINPVSDGELYRDDGTSYSMQIRLAKWDGGTRKRKFIREIRLIADQSSGGTALMEYSDDDYATFTQLGSFDLSQPQPKLTRCGSHVGGRSYRLSHSDNAAFRGSAIEIDYDVGAI